MLPDNSSLQVCEKHPSRTALQEEKQKHVLNTQHRRKANKEGELELVKDMKENRKGFYNYRTKKTRESVLPSVIDDQVSDGEPVKSTQCLRSFSLHW